MFYLTINDDMGDAADETGKVLAEHERAKREKQEEIARQIAAHLGPHASTADQSYVARLAALAGKKKAKKVGKGGKKSKGQAGDEDGTDDVEISQTNNQQPPAPPPPPSAGAIGITTQKLKTDLQQG